MVTKLAVAAFLIAHGMIHTGFVSPRPARTAGGPEWPFSLSTSWVLRPLGVPADLTRLLGVALVAATCGGFALAAVAALASLPEAIWVTSVLVGAVASAAVLLLFFHPWLIVGLAIDVALAWAVVAAHWTV